MKFSLINFSIIYTKIVAFKKINLCLNNFEIFFELTNSYCAGFKHANKLLVCKLSGCFLDYLSEC